MTLCEAVQSQFSDYLDGAVSGYQMHALAAHLNACEPCAKEFEALRSTQQLLCGIGPAKPPAELSLRLRVAISQERARTARRELDRWQLYWQNSMGPFVGRAAGGLATAAILLGALTLMIGTFAAPPPLAANDVTTDNVSTPRLLYTAANTNARVAVHDPVLVEAQISQTGRVYDFQIVSGPVSPAIRAEIDNLLLMSQFSPALFYGKPVAGRAILSFSGVAVRG